MTDFGTNCSKRCPYDLDSLNHDPVAMYLADLLTIPVNLAGLPGISIPAGFAQGPPVGTPIDWSQIF